MASHLPSSAGPDGVVTELLARWQAGDAVAFDRVAEIVYPELRRVAEAYLHRERSDHTLQPTALVHEAFLKLVHAGALAFDSRRHFYALAAQLMRRTLVDHARAVRTAKRGGGESMVSLEAVSADGPIHALLAADRFLALHEALDDLTAHDARKGRVIELRYFGGLTLEETAELLDVSLATAHREQRFAEAWLAAALAQ